MKRLTVTALVAALLVVGSARAHEGATGIVKDRMDGMQRMGETMKMIADRLAANRDLAAIGPDAGAIAATARRIPALFPPGSDWKPTDAKPEIWTGWDDFAAKSRNLDAEAMKLAQLVQGGDPTAIGAQFRKLRAACADCHDAYRAKHGH